MTRPIRAPTSSRARTCSISPRNTATVPIPDAHTGLTGFPLSLNGLFFDRQYAGAGAGPGFAATQFPSAANAEFQRGERSIGGQSSATATTGNYNNDGQHPLGDYHVWPRLPGYSNIGTQLANTATNAYNGTTFNYFDVNNQTPDGVRTKDINDIGGLTNGVDARLPALPAGANPQAGDQISDDINPSGQDVAWFYTGSSNGSRLRLHARDYRTRYGSGRRQHPVRRGQPRIGRETATTRNSARTNLAITGTPTRVGIYTQTDLNAILASLAGTGNTPIIARDASNAGVPGLANTWPKQSIAAKNGKNYYEWGETVYILVYDALARPYTANLRRFQRFIPTIPLNGGIPQGGGDQSIRVTVSTINGNIVNNPIISLEGVNYATTGGRAPAWSTISTRRRVNMKFTTRPPLWAARPRRRATLLRSGSLSTNTFWARTRAIPIRRRRARCWKSA